MSSRSSCSCRADGTSQSSVLGEFKGVVVLRFSDVSPDGLVSMEVDELVGRSVKSVRRENGLDDGGASAGAFNDDDDNAGNPITDFAKLRERIFEQTVAISRRKTLGADDLQLTSKKQGCTMRSF